MKLYQEIEKYQSVNEQEEKDKQVMLQVLKTQPDCFVRDNQIVHFTASTWTVNKDRTKVLMAYHNLYASWAWSGGHADGEEDLRVVALKELQEETGVTHAKLVSDDIFSLEILTVDGHVKKGTYVPSHLHLNVTYLAEADECETLTVKADENQAVKWWSLDEVSQVVTEPWMIEHIYKKLNAKLTKI